MLSNLNVSNTLVSGNKIFTPLLSLIFHLLLSIRESDIKLNYMSFFLVDERRWNINLNNGVKILLPETKVLDTLKLLKKLDSKYNVLGGKFVEIDLRIYRKFFLKPKIN